MKFLFFASLILLFSCNKGMFVDKSKIVHHAEGYLFYYPFDKCVFVPSNDTSLANFMSDTATKKGYLLTPACDIDGLKNVAEKFNVDIVFMENQKEVLIPDSVYLTTTSFRYILNRPLRANLSSIVEVEYKGKRIRINVAYSFYGEVLKFAGNTI
ncbi:MAG: hypothetical protein J0G98_10030 [Terrimonas ferruginea]|uniref:hypothetical protein n=1 Tax=Terrimonas ferruginea TaxID=249 RepID=UPI00086D01C6|nr:hypothetical protein [Terrimonas ferruginea]MBN8783394.1 hypothetical protein [Terrimonas ferruginea]ODS71908.1 MAG: hypothetical protein ABS46_21225 [Cytophagaceae bacterium SCN 52-12]